MGLVPGASRPGASAEVHAASRWTLEGGGLGFGLGGFIQGCWVGGQVFWAFLWFTHQEMVRNPNAPPVAMLYEAYRSFTVGLRRLVSLRHGPS